MSDFKYDFSHFSQDKLAQIKNNAEKIKQFVDNGESLSAMTDVDMNELFASSDTISTDDLIANLSDGKTLEQLSEKEVAQYSLYADLIADGDNEITKTEAEVFALLDGNGNMLSAVNDMQKVLTGTDDLEALILAADNSLSALSNVPSAPPPNYQLHTLALNNSNINIINSGAEFDPTTGTYSVKVEKYQDAKVDDGQGGKRYCNGSLWGITENVYGDKVDKETVYKFIEEMNPKFKETQVIHPDDVLKLPILQFDNDGNIIGYLESEQIPGPTQPTNNTSSPTVPTEDTNVNGNDNTTPTLPTEDTNVNGNDNTTPTLPTEDTNVNGNDNTTPTLPTEDTNVENDDTTPTLPTEDTKSVGGGETKPTIPDDGNLMGGKIDGDKYQGKTISKYEMYLESNFASFSKEYDANGELDKAAYQGATGDCVLVSGCYAFASTEKGAEMIKDMITINKNDKGEVESYTVRFDGIDEEYTISQKELKSATRPKLSRMLGNYAKYAGGDEDMTLLELAYKKCAKNTKSDKVDFGFLEKNCGV